MIMTRVHIVRVMKLAFFFSYSDDCGGSGACDCQRAVVLGRGGEATVGATAPFLVGLLGSEPFSLYSDMLIEGRRARPLLALRCWCWNLTSLRGRVMVATCGGAGNTEARQEQSTSTRGDVVR